MNGTNHLYWDTRFSIKPMNGEAVENFKRRRTLRPFNSLDVASRLFFQRILTVKRAREIVFITRAGAKSR